MNMIRERVEKYRALTTHTKADRPTPYEGNTWSADRGVEEQVRRDEAIREAEKPVVPFKPIPELPYQKPDRLSLWRFVQGVLP